MNKIGLRKAWFQVHKWIGLILAVLIIPISLTGAALVWDEPIQEWLHPERFAVAGPADLSADRYADAARAVLGTGEILSRLEAAGRLKRIPFEDRAAMQKLAEPVMQAYAKEVDASGIQTAIAGV